MRESLTRVAAKKVFPQNYLLSCSLCPLIIPRSLIRPFSFGRETTDLWKRLQLRRGANEKRRLQEFPKSS